MSEEKKLVSIVIPAYNEEDAIGKTLDEINKTIDKLESKYKFEIIVVDNNSTDRTTEIAKSKGANVFFEPKQGYGNAYKKGFSVVNGDIIITGDADCTYPFEDIPRFLEILENNEEIIFINTNRFKENEEGSMSKTHYFGNFVLTKTFQILFGKHISDSQSGMWIFRKEFLDLLVFDLMSDGMPFSQEIKAIACIKGLKIIEIPIKYRKRIGKVKLNTFKDGFLNLYRLFKFKLIYDKRKR